MEICTVCSPYTIQNNKTGCVYKASYEIKYIELPEDDDNLIYV